MVSCMETEVADSNTVTLNSSNKLIHKKRRFYKNVYKVQSTSYLSKMF